jgi:hypothetical protein
MSTERAAFYRQRAAESEFKATKAKAEESRRAWLIVARDWKRMAVREEAKVSLEALEQSRQFAASSTQHPTSPALDELIKLTR